MITKLKCTIYVDVESFSLESRNLVASEFISETDYKFDNTLNIRVLKTEFRHCEPVMTII